MEINQDDNFVLKTVFNKDAVKELKTGVLSVGKLLQDTNLIFPIYQRPYKWETKNVIQLMDDIIGHKHKTAYRLGTIVIHAEGKQHNVVDGQQRTITLLLIAKAILKAVENNEINIESKSLLELLKKIKLAMIKPTFTNEIAIANIQNNYREIERLVSAMDENAVAFLFNKCEFIQFILTDISEAFQFFDSQNARGKDLDPHDLLKAYHLREFDDRDETQKVKVIETWEDMETNELVSLFGEYLFRIKAWSKGGSARYFTKNEVALFKGITMSKIENYPYTKPLRIAHFYVDGYNLQNERNIDLNQMDFPFQLDQTIINGRRFFEMITHYKVVFDNYKISLASNTSIDEKAKNIIYAINNYDGKSRVGDSYIRMMFDCALMYYIDKFGNIELSRAIEKFFIWAYSLRLRHQAVYLASVDNYVLEENNVFRIMKDSTTPQAILALYIPPIQTVNATKMDFKDKDEKANSLKDLFKTLKYYYGE